MVDIFLYPGEPQPNDVRLSNPATVRGVTIHGDATASYAVTTAAAAGREIFKGPAAALYAVTTSAAAGRLTIGGGVMLAFNVTGVTGTAKEIIGAVGSFNFVQFGVSVPSGAGTVTADIVGDGAAAYAVTEASGSGTIPITTEVSSGGFGGSSATHRPVTRVRRSHPFPFPSAAHIETPPFVSASVLAYVAPLRASCRLAFVMMPLKASCRLASVSVEIGPDLVLAEEEELLLLLELLEV